MTSTWPNPDGSEPEKPEPAKSEPETGTAGPEKETAGREPTEEEIAATKRDSRTHSESMGSEPDGDGRGADAPQDEGSYGTPQAYPREGRAPTSPYARMTKKNSSVRNVVWALGLTLGVVVIIGVLFFGVGDQPQPDVPETSQLDVAESAERADAAAPFPVAAPELSDEWEPRQAQFNDGSDPQWEVRYSSPRGVLVTMVQARAVEAPLLSSRVPGAHVQEELTVAGADCAQLRSDSDDVTALSCEGDGWGLLVHGSTDTEELLALAEAAITEIDRHAQ